MWADDRNLNEEKYLYTTGIGHQLTVRYSPQQNGMAERMYRILLNHTRSMLLSRNINRSFWAEALLTAVHIRNRVTSRSLLENTTPYHRWMGEAPNLSYVRTFGAKCWYVIPRMELKKLDARSQESMMAGYAPNSKGYKLWDAKLNKFIISRDVRFDESISAPQSDQLVQNETSLSESASEPDTNGSENELAQAEDASDTADEEEETNQIPSDIDQTSDQSKSSNQPLLRRSNRASKKPQRMYDPSRYGWRKKPSTAAIATEIDSQTPPMYKTIGANLHPRDVFHNESEFALISHGTIVPQTYKQATSDELISTWQPAIDKEHDSLLRNHTGPLSRDCLK